MKLKIKIIPGSSRDCIVGFLGEVLKIKVKAQAEKGKANQAVLHLLAAKLHIPKSNITLLSGHTQAYKTIELNNIEKSLIISLLKSGSNKT